MQQLCTFVSMVFYKCENVQLDDGREAEKRIQQQRRSVRRSVDFVNNGDVCIFR